MIRVRNSPEQSRELTKGELVSYRFLQYVDACDSLSDTCDGCPFEYILGGCPDYTTAHVELAKEKLEGLEIIEY